MIAIIDYGMGNLRSVQKAFAFLGADARITDDAAVIREASHVVLPGVGAFRDAIARADAVLFVWSAPSLAGNRVRDTLETLANHLAPTVKPGRRYALAGSPYALDPSWTTEDGGHTLVLAPGRNAPLELSLAGLPARPARAAVTLFSADGAALPPLPVPCEPAALTNGAVLRVPVAAPADAPLRLTAFRLDLQ